MSGNFWLDKCTIIQFTIALRLPKHKTIKIIHSALISLLFILSEVESNISFHIFFVSFSKINIYLPNKTKYFHNKTPLRFKSKYYIFFINKKKIVERIIFLWENKTKPYCIYTDILS